MATTLVTARFGSIAFPVDEVVLQGGHRFHIHEYPHAPGGDPERLGRKLYIIRMHAWFHELEGAAAQRYPDLWPNGLKQLRKLLERGYTDELVVPTVGAIKAFPTAWTQKLVASKSITGEELDLEFCEDDASFELAGSDFEVASSSVAQANTELQAAAELEKYLSQLKRKHSIFEVINDAVGSFQAARDQVGLVGGLVTAKLANIVDLCNEADRTLDFMSKADGVFIAQALRNLSFAATTTNEKLQGPERKRISYVVPTKTTVVDLATKLYGDASKTAELLKLNAFKNPYAIEGGTIVDYMAAA